MSAKVKMFRWAIGLLAFVLFLFSSYKIGCYKVEELQSEAVTDTLIEKAVQTTPNIPLYMEIENVDDEPIEYVPITVDFDKLKAENEDIIAWIYCEDTPINYPIVQSKDNNYYLRRLIDGTWNTAGSLFLDYRCNAAFSDGFSIVYGHNMKNNTMFGTLPKYNEQSYYDEHPTIYLLTPEKDFRVDLIAGYATPSDSDAYKLDRTPEEMDRFMEESLKASTFTTTACSDGERYLILSTCSYEYSNARYVLIGKMTEIGK